MAILSKSRLILRTHYVSAGGLTKMLKAKPNKKLHGTEYLFQYVNGNQMSIVIQQK